ncbi:hypothetical protein Mapa_002009 [Marchantia paleacea]|nr:hypothetical protein Mapa_002009 [Marchantia paleacea]
MDFLFLVVLLCSVLVVPVIFIVMLFIINLLESLRVPYSHLARLVTLDFVLRLVNGRLELLRAKLRRLRKLLHYIASGLSCSILPRYVVPFLELGLHLSLSHLSLHFWLFIVRSARALESSLSITIKTPPQTPGCSFAPPYSSSLYTSVYNIRPTRTLQPTRN